MLHVTLLRHAESEFNQDKTSVTRDCPLSARGEQQAAALAGSWPLVLVSPLRRAQQTFALSKIHGDLVLTCELAREQRADPCDFQPGEDMILLENDDDLAVRVDAFLRDLRARVRGDNGQLLYDRVLIVSHCEFICALTGVSLYNACMIDIDIPLH